MVLQHAVSETALQEPYPYIAGESIKRDESPLPETPSLKNLAKMFELPEGADEKNRQLLHDASDEMVALFKKPIVKAKSVIYTDAVAEERREIFRTELRRTAEALTFLDNLCKNLGASDESKVILAVDNEEGGGLRLKLSNENGYRMGKIFSAGINSVDIVIRTGQEASDDTYTPMQLNFRFLTDGKPGMPDEEISSLRVDLHNRNQSNEVQLDINLAWVKYIESVHQKIKTLSSTTEEETREKFNILLSAFLLNFTGENLANNDQVIIGGESDRNRMSQKHLDKARKRASNKLSIVEDEKEEKAELTPEQQEVAISLNSIQELLSTKVSPELLKILAEAINGNGENEQLTVIGWMLGKDNFGTANLEEAMRSKERIIYMLEFLQNNFSGNEKDAFIWQNGYPENIQSIKEAVEEKIVEEFQGEKATKLDRELDKILSFMAIVPLSE